VEREREREADSARGVESAESVLIPGYVPFTANSTLSLYSKLDARYH
jgi:hypothetical protein